MKYAIKQFLVSNKSILTQQLAPGGGCAISIKKATKAEIKGLRKA
jgi:hypothetical protein